MTEFLADGVYLNLPESIYFAQDRYGSSDVMRWHLMKHGWWWKSRFNPDYTDDRSDAMNYGSALHALMLEGLAAYEERFFVEPDKREFKDLLITVPQIKEALENEAMLDLKGTSKYALADWEDAAATHLPDRHVWGNIMRDFKARSAILDDDGEVIGQHPSVSAVEDRMLRVMLDAAMDNDDMRALLDPAGEWPHIAELSFLWTDEHGLRRRARFDRIVPNFTMDLKTLGNWQGRELEHAVDDHIKRMGYDIQLADQHDARHRMHAMIREEGDACMFGGSIEHRAFLQAIAERDVPFDWVWLFYQKPEMSGRAPIIFPVKEVWRGPYHVSGVRKAERAKAFFHEAVKRFGLGDTPSEDGRPSRPWARVMPVHYVGENDHPGQPHLTLSHYGWDDNPVPNEEDHFTR